MIRVMLAARPIDRTYVASFSLAALERYFIISQPGASFGGPVINVIEDPGGDAGSFQVPSSGTYGDVTVGISPEWNNGPGEVFSGAFQSDSGTGASRNITVTFSKAVASLTITVLDPTWVGNRIITYGAAGEVLANAGILGSGQHAALTTGSAFWSGQLDKPKAVGTACLRADVTSARTRSLILAHEGTQMERDSHNELMKRAGDGLIAPAVEGVVGRDAQFVAQWSTAIALVFAEMLRRATATDDINPVRFGCNFNFVYSTPKNGA